MKTLKLDNIAVITQNLPKGFDRHIRDVKRSDSELVLITRSYTNPEREYKVTVLKGKTGLKAHCTCKGYTTLARAAHGSIDPCSHIAAALTTSDWVSPLVTNQGAISEKTEPELRSSTEPISETSTPVSEAASITRDQTLKESQGITLVRPIASIEATLESFKAFQHAKKALLEKNDFQRVFDGQYIKKSGWRKIAVFFGVTLAKVNEVELEGETRTWATTYRAIAPGGQYQDATGYCSWSEQMGEGRIQTAKTTADKKVKSGTWTQDKADQYVAAQRAKLEHDIRATAETRAKNRAISDLVGGGELSAEEATV